MKINAKKGEYLEVLLRSSKTVFTTADVALLWNEDKKGTITHRLHSYAKSGKLIHLRQGIYAKDENYNRLELATRVYTPAYVSFETVLAQAGIIFQHYHTIFVASYVSRTIVIDNQKISYVRVKSDILRNTEGITQHENYAVATPERALLDRIYSNKQYYFDNLSTVDWNVVFTLVPIYNNNTMEKTVQRYYDDFKKTL